MLYLSLILILTLVTLGGLIGYQVVRVRRGVITTEMIDSEAENPFSEQNLTILRNTVSDWMAARSRKIILWVLRISIKFGYFVKNKLDGIVSKVHRVAARHEQKMLQEEENTGSFLDTISEYRDRIRNDKEE